MSSTPIRDLLLPASDRTAGIQVVVVIAIAVAVAWLVRRERALVLFTTGVAMLVLGLMALHTLH